MVVVYAGFGTSPFTTAKEYVYFAVAGLDTFVKVVIIGIAFRAFHPVCSRLFLRCEFAIACRGGYFICMIAQLDAIKAVEVLEPIGIAANAIDIVTTDA